MRSLIPLSWALVACAPAPEDAAVDDSASAGTIHTGDTTQDTVSDDCPLNSGWPCTCAYVATCDDGSDCIAISALSETSGFCALSCLGTADMESCTATAFAAEEGCAMANGAADQFWCALECTVDGECPSDQRCVEAGVGTICYPAD